LPIISKSAVWRSERVRESSVIVSLIGGVSPIGSGKGLFRR
jgi:hypothetical protein